MLRTTFAFLGLLTLAACTSVDSTEHCVETRYGEITNEKMSNGPTILVLSDATCFPLTDQNFPERTGDDSDRTGVELSANTADPVRLTANVAVVYRYDPATVVKLFREKRSQAAAEAEILKAIQTGFTSATGSWTVERIFSAQQASFADSVRAHIQAKLGSRAIIANVYVANLSVPPAIEAARIEAAKQAQLLDKAKKEREIAEATAEASLVRARANAEANRLMAQSYASDPVILKLKVAEAYANGLARACKDGTHTCIIGGSTLDMLTRTTTP